MQTFPEGYCQVIDQQSEEFRSLVRKFKAFIAETFLLGDDPEGLDVNGSLLEQGVIDSTGVIELVQFIEGEFGVDVPDSDVVPANFGSIAGLVGYVVKQTQAA